MKIFVKHGFMFIVWCMFTINVFSIKSPRKGIKTPQTINIEIKNSIFLPIDLISKIYNKFKNKSFAAIKKHKKDNPQSLLKIFECYEDRLILNAYFLQDESYKIRTKNSLREKKALYFNAYGDLTYNKYNPTIICQISYFSPKTILLNNVMNTMYQQIDHIFDGIKHDLPILEELNLEYGENYDDNDNEENLKSSSSSSEEEEDVEDTHDTEKIMHERALEELDKDPIPTPESLEK